MADFLLSPGLHLALFLCAILFAVFTIRQSRLMWACLASVCAICACLLGLAAGRTLEQLLIGLLVPTAIILLSQTDREGSGEA